MYCTSIRYTIYDTVYEYTIYDIGYESIRYTIYDRRVYDIRESERASGG